MTVFLVLLAGAYLFGAVVLGDSIRRSGEDYKSWMNENTAILNFEDRLLNAKEWLMPKSQWEKKRKWAGEAERCAAARLDECYTSSAFLAAATAAYLAAGFFFLRKRDGFCRLFALWLTMAAAIFLWVGLFTPMMEVAAYSENLTIPLKLKPLDLSKTFEGRMYYYYQNKSVVDLIHILFASGNIVVGVSILFFSVINPVAKIVCSVSIMSFPRLVSVSFLRMFVFVIGKFSMADVFVVAAFLAYLSFANMNTGIATEATTLPGLFFFAGFVILSTATSLFIQLAFDDMVKTACL
ncbi:MAG: paraquat-inducible protein A [Verrucomicrobiae bacterium]